jgi:multidrug efflux pump subunit AcrA (membrane-fusion protein)
MLEKLPSPATEAKLLEPDEPAIETIGSPARRSRWGGILIGVTALVLLCGGIYLGIRGRTSAEAALARETQEMAVPIVDVVAPHVDAPDQALVLPGQTMAFTDTPIHARTSGYLKQWYFDIGARVKQGQLLAMIETPEIDQQLLQARADLKTAETNYKLAQITAARAMAMEER